MAVVIESQKQVDLDKGIKANVEIVDGKLQLEVVGEGTVYQTQTAIPNMTSNTSPRGVVTASTEYSNHYAAWRAFNSSTGDCWRTNGTSNEWIAYEFPEKKIIYMYTITSESTNTAPRSWRFEGTNDDLNWDVLDERGNQPSWQSGEKRVFEILNRKPYKKYRLFIYSSRGSNYRIELRYVEMMEATLGTVYSSYGTFESPIYDLSIYSQEIKTISAIRNIPEGTDMKIYTSTSNDQITFSDYEEIDYATGGISSPQGRYIKIKVELFGKTNESENMVNEFSEDERDEFQDDKYLEFDEGLRLKTEYIENMEEVESWSDEGGVYTKSIEILDFNNIKSIIYDYEGVTRSFIYHNGEYKKWDDDWQVVSTSFPTIQQFQDEGMDGLSVLDRTPSQFEQEMTDAGVLGEGKLFKTTIDLKRYIDINSLSRE